MSATVSGTIAPMSTEDKPLTAADRCDACGAQAYLRATLGLAELLFCLHHSKDNRQTLADKGWIIFDETKKLDPVPYVPED